VNSGTLTVTGSVFVTDGGNARIELGRGDGVASTPFIDFHSGATAVDFDSRIIASGGTGTSEAGTLTYQAATSNFQVAGINRATINSTGLAVTGAISSTTGANFATSSGNVGIGTSSPAYKLDIVASLGGGFNLSNGVDSTLRVLLPTTGITYDNVNYGYHAWLVGGTERARIDASGNVGIGTSSPAKKLDVAGDALISGLTVGKGAGAIASNTAVGSGALNANTTGTQNTASGLNALLNNTTGANNTASGHSALQNNTTGSGNTASGASALKSNTTGNYNTAVGEAAMLQATSGNDNVAVGRVALRFNTGNENVAVGNYSLGTNTTGTANTAIGASALNLNTTGSNNTSTGLNSLRTNTTGGSNTANGVGALQNNTTGSGNTALNPLNSAGAYAPVFDPTTANNRFCMGSTGVTNAYIQVAWTVVSDARDKTNFAPVPHGLEFVKALQPTAYQFRTARDSEETNGGVRYGFKAQDVLALEGANPVIVDNEDADKLRMIDTALIPVLVKALQELNAKFDAYVLTHP